MTRGWPTHNWGTQAARSQLGPARDPVDEDGDKHGGTLSYQPTPGGWSTFLVQLPLWEG